MVYRDSCLVVGSFHPYHEASQPGNDQSWQRHCFRCQESWSCSQSPRFTDPMRLALALQGHTVIIMLWPSPRVVWGVRNSGRHNSYPHSFTRNLGSVSQYCLVQIVRPCFGSKDVKVAGHKAMSNWYIDHPRRQRSLQVYTEPRASHQVSHSY